MANLSIRTRLFLLVGIFSAVSILISTVGIFGVSTVEQDLTHMIDNDVEARRIAQALDRNFEQINANSNALITMTVNDDLQRYFRDQDQLFGFMDLQLGSLVKMLTGDELGLVEQLKPLIEDYKRRNTILRKLATVNAADRAVVQYLGEHEELIQRIRDLLSRSAEALDHSHPATAQLVRGLHISLSLMNEWLGECVMETNDTKMTEHSRRMTALWDKLSEQIRQLQEIDSEGQRVAVRIVPLLESYRKASLEIEQLTRANDRHQMIELARKGDAAVDVARNLIVQLHAHLVAKMDAKRFDIQHANIQVKTFLIIFAVLGVTAACVFAFFTVKRVYGGVEGVQRVVWQVTDASVQIREATQSLAQRSSEEASSLEETSSTMEQMTATVEQNRVGAAKAKELSERNSEAAQKNAQVTSQAADAMASLKQASTKISEISETVTEIAFQTNILALDVFFEAEVA